MGKTIKKIFALVLAFAMCMTFAVVSSAYVDYCPNTHRNTGHHIADLIGVAKTQLGYTELNTSTGLPLAYGQDGGYTKYGAWFGDSTGAWCAYFVSWCAHQAGIPTSIVPRLGNCAATVNWYKNHSRYYPASSGYIPKTGDIVFFNWSGGSVAKHIGIITGVSGSNVYTIEGNTDSNVGYRCAGKTRSRSAGYIIGYGVPNYNDASTYVGSYSFASSFSKSASRSQSIAYSTSKLTVITTSATDITSTNAVLNGSVKNTGKLKVKEAGFTFGKEQKSMKKYAVAGSSRDSEIELAMNVSEVTKETLTPSTKYFYQSYVTISGKDYFGPTYAVVTVNDKPQELVLSETEVNVGVGQTAEIFSAQLPIGSTDKGVTWTSEDENIATVSNGIVSGAGYGKVTVIAKTNYGDAQAKCNVNVLIPKAENVTLTNTSEKEITVSWDAVEGAKGYMIYRKQASDEKFALLKEVKSDVTSYTDSKVDAGERYYYRIVTAANKEIYNSDPTETVYTTARLAAPQNVKASSFIASTERITWDTVDGARGYTVYRSDSPNGLYTVAGTVNNVAEFVDKNIFSGKDYYYKVSAFNDNERTVSEYSATAHTLSTPTELGFIDFHVPEIETEEVRKEDSKICRACGKFELFGSLV